MHTKPVIMSVPIKYYNIKLVLNIILLTCTLDNESQFINRYYIVLYDFPKRGLPKYLDVLHINTD